MFNTQHFVRSSAGDYSKNTCPPDFRYWTEDDTLTVVSVSGYFDEIKLALAAGSLITVNGSDGTQRFIVTAVDPVTVSTDINVGNYFPFAVIHGTTTADTLQDFAYAGLLTTDTIFGLPQGDTTHELEGAAPRPDPDPTGVRAWYDGTQVAGVPIAFLVMRKGVLN